MKPQYCRFRESRHFTLVEIMVACLIFSVAIMGAFSMFIGGYRVMFRTQAKLEVNSYLRKATNRLVMDGRSASYFILYDRFDGSNHLTPPAATPTFVDFRSSPGQGRRSVGESGNCLVFVYNGVNPTPFNPLSITPVERLVVYTLDTKNVSENGVYRFRRGEVVIPGGSTDPVESLIPAATASDFPASELDVAIPLVRGMLDGNVFHNLDGISVLMNGHFFYGNPAQDIGMAGVKSATHTYSFTIKPRGSA